MYQPKGDQTQEQAQVNIGKKSITEGFKEALWYCLAPEEKETNGQSYKWKCLNVTVKRS